MKFKFLLSVVTQFLLLAPLIQTSAAGSSQSGTAVYADFQEGGVTTEEPESTSSITPGRVLPFRLSNGYLILVNGQIGAQTRLKFILDTGASISIVSSKIADTLNLKRQPAGSFNFDRKLAWEQATVPEVRFGAIEATGIVMLVGDLAKYSEFARNVDAIIGLDLLKFANFSVDYGVKKIIIHSFSQGSPVNRNEALSNCLILEIQVQGHPIRLIVDTGFPDILLFEERLLSKVPDLAITADVFNVTLGNRLHGKRTTLHGVRIGQRSNDFSVLLTKAPAPDVLPGIDGVVGIGPLSARRVNFDFSKETLSWQ